MKKLTLLFLLLAACSAHATQPPRPGELKRYHTDGTLAERIDAGKARGNHRVRPDVAARTLQRLQNMSSDRKVNAPLPAWQGMPTTGTNRILILLVEFPDHAKRFDASNIDNAVFGDGDASQFPTESLADYYQRSSYDLLQLQGNVLGWHTAKHDRVWYTNTSPNDNAANNKIIQEIVDAYPSHDYSQYDNNGDGFVDYVAVIWTGPDTGWNGFWWGYQWSLDSDITTDDGTKIDSFSWQWEYNSDYNRYSTLFDPEVIIHETGHALGLPDYYDYDTDIGPDGGIGDLDMMDGTKGDHNAFSKYMLEWLTPTFVTNGSQHLTLRAMAQHPDAVIAMRDYTNATAYGEYFLVENRHRVQNDSSGMPSDGMLIWHVDATPNGSGRDFEYDNSYTPHKLLRLMEADGLEEIETGDGKGDAGDYYNQNETFGPATTPNSLRYDASHSYVYVTNLSANSTSMTVDVTVDLGAVPPTIGHTPEQLLAWIEFGTSNNNQGIEVWINGGSNAAYHISDDADWLSVMPTNGVSDGTHNAHIVMYNTDSLPVGLYNADITITSPLSINSPMIVPVIVQIYGTNLPEAVDATNLSWRTGGDAEWFLQTASTYYDDDAAQNGAINDDQMSWIETEVLGPGSINFWWRSSTEASWDFLRCYIDGTMQGVSISGNVDWRQETLSIWGAGSHTIRWQYEKDDTLAEGLDAVWLDQVVWTPDTTDTDGDGLYDWQEAVAGTSTTNADSSLNINSVHSGMLDDTVVLQWPSVSGRLYSVSLATNLQTEFEPVATNLAADIPMNIYTVATAVATSAFYRVGVHRAPVSDVMLLNETFDSTSTPAGWSVLALDGTSALWRFDNPNTNDWGNWTGGNGNFAIADSDFAGSVQMNTDLRSPVLDCSNMETVTLQFKSDYDVYNSALAEVRLRIDGGAWQTVWQRTALDWGPLTYTLDLTALVLGQSSVEIAFHYEAFWDWYWQIDDVKVYGQPIH